LRMREVLFQYLYIRKNRGISSPFFEFQAKRPSEFACLRTSPGWKRVPFLYVFRGWDADAIERSLFPASTHL